jgi:hypothetical protein
MLAATAIMYVRRQAGLSLWTKKLKAVTHLHKAEVEACLLEYFDRILKPKSGPNHLLDKSQSNET